MSVAQQRRKVIGRRGSRSEHESDSPWMLHSNVATPDNGVTMLKTIRLDSIDFLCHLSAEMEGRARSE